MICSELNSATLALTRAFMILIHILYTYIRIKSNPYLCLCTSFKKNPYILFI